MLIFKIFWYWYLRCSDVVLDDPLDENFCMYVTAVLQVLEIKGNVRTGQRSVFYIILIKTFYLHNYFTKIGLFFSTEKELEQMVN